MATQNVLKEFLVALGFKVDEQQFKRFELYWDKTGKHFLQLGKHAAEGGLAVAAGVTVISNQLTRLYYIAQRAGTNVGSLQAFQFGARQVGVDANQAAAALEGMAAAMRLQPGTRGLLASFGIDPNNKDTVQTLLKLLDVTRRMPYYQGAQFASMFGIDEQTYFQLTKNYDQLKKQYTQRKDLAAGFGLNADDLAGKSRQFTNDLNQIGARFEVLGMVLAKDLLPVMDWAVRAFDKVLSVLGPLDKATHGASTAIIAFGVAAFSVARAIGIARALFSGITGRNELMKALSKLGGRGGAAAAGEGAEAAEGAGLVAGEEGAVAAGPVGWVVGLGVALAAALVWMELHPDKVRAAVKGSWNWIKNEASTQAATFSKDIHAAVTAAKSLGVGKSIAAGVMAINPSLGAALWKGSDKVAGLRDSLADSIMKFEGVRKKAYRDIAGNLTIGAGHLIRPGENFQGGINDQQISQLLSQDIGSARGWVQKLVKAKLNQNQRDALTDFIFNVGSGKFAGSTLLRDVNQGDFQGAAKEFMRWNKAKINGTYQVVPDLSRRRQYEADLFQKPVTLQQETNIHVSGVTDPQAAARETARQQSQVNGRLIRNLSGVVDTPGATLGTATP
jgi:GH24 family phage-related lysozyme (muramidase)